MERGCDSKDFKCPDTTNCSRCIGQGCNYEGYRNGYCVSCSGDVNSDCGINVGIYLDINTESCPISFRTPLCYTFFDGLASRIYRGCTANSIYTSAYLQRCKTEENSTCITCNSNYCNYFTKHIVISASWCLTVSQAILLLLIVFNLSMSG